MTPAARPAWVGLGSNLSDPVRQVLGATSELASLPETRLVRASGLFRSPPMGPRDQPDFINAVVLLQTCLEPLVLLDRLQLIEQAHGRQRARRWGERTLDLDLLVYGNERIDLPRLTVPHPGIPHRAFVLYPLVEVSPELEIPGYGSVAGLLAALPLEAVARRLEDPQ
ncbi:MAG: 2-amino-4-hydroxy-6-hydroxymethyldihydropteridine diphosphokinase [Ectothiorhodospiraceae bacterium]|nr:2-amino-4-hydroxy-6-hydroxymethyldihydropteridine diphosphokinase [Ectothiorhodospiraceae bacterium]